MEYRIVNLSSEKIRKAAREALAGHWKQAALFMGLYYLITTGMDMVLDLFFYSTQSVNLPIEGTTEVTTMTANLTYGSTIYEFIIGGPVAWSVSKYFLDFFRTKRSDCTTLFEGFSCFAKAFTLMLFMSVRIILWSLLFIIPGLIASFRYSQAFYIMVDHPEYTPTQCLNESAKMMSGNKLKLFYLQFSFIGWIILTTIPSVLYTGGTDTLAGVVITFLLLIPSMVLDAYLNVAVTVFYELASDNLVIVDQEESFEPVHPELPE